MRSLPFNCCGGLNLFKNKKASTRNRIEAFDIKLNVQFGYSWGWELHHSSHASHSAHSAGHAAWHSATVIVVTVF
jgi:hypothetical protein